MAHRNMQWIQSHILLLYQLPGAVRHIYELAIAKQLLSATIGVFIPLYLYVKTGSLFFPVVYVILARGALSIPILLGVAKLMGMIGIERVMYLGVLALVLESGAALLPLNTLTVLILALFEAVSQVTYWSSFHYAFGLFGKKREVTEEVAGLSVLLSIITILAPLLMGALVIGVGFHNAFLVMLLVGVGATTYLLRHFDKTYRVRTDVQKILRPPFAGVFLTAGVYLFAPIFIGIYAYALGKTVESFSIFLAMTGLASAVISLFVAAIVDHKRLFWLALVEPAVCSIIFLIYPNVTNIVVLFSLEVVRQFATAMGIAIYGAIYSVAKRWPEILLGRDLYIYIGRTLAGAIVLLKGTNFETLFMFGAVSAVLYALALKKMVGEVEKLLAPRSSL